MNEHKEVIEINGVEFSYDTEKAYEKDGHVYCKTCNEQIDGKEIELPFRKTKFIFTKECKCDRERRDREEKEQRAYEVEKLKDRCFYYDKPLKTASLDEIDGKEESTIVQAKAYVETFNQMFSDNIGILLSGPVGTGKSYIAAAIANGIMEKYQYSVKFRSIPQIIRDMQKNGLNSDQNQYLSDVCSAKLIIFDDLGIERKTEYVTELLYSIINERHRKNMPTIITTNIPISEFRSENIPTEFQRVYSRILSMCNINITVNGRDRRKDEDIEKTKKAMKTIKEYMKTQEGK